MPIKFFLKKTPTNPQQKIVGFWGSCFFIDSREDSQSSEVFQDLRKLSNLRTLASQQVKYVTRLAMIFFPQKIVIQIQEQLRIFFQPAV